jgi:hypothetical protein
VIHHQGDQHREKNHGRQQSQSGTVSQRVTEIETGNGSKIDEEKVSETYHDDHCSGFGLGFGLGFGFGLGYGYEIGGFQHHV